MEVKVIGKNQVQVLVTNEEFRHLTACLEHSGDEHPLHDTKHWARHAAEYLWPIFVKLFLG